MATGLTDPLVLASIPPSVAATIAAVLSYRANHRTKETNVIAATNTEKLDRLGNGYLDEKIRRCVHEVLDDRGHDVTEAFITDILAKVLDSHLQDGEN